MQQLGKVQTQTTWANASDAINKNSDKLYEAVTALEHATFKQKGYFISLEALQEAYPTPQVGWQAFIYNPDNQSLGIPQYDLYSAVAVNGNEYAWELTSSGAGDITVDVNEINQAIEELDKAKVEAIDVNKSVESIEENIVNKVNAKIKSLTNRDGEVFYPLTHTDAVLDKQGKSVSEVEAETNAKITELEENKVDKNAIVQESGDSEAFVMSQKVVTEKLTELEKEQEEFEQAIRNQVENYRPIVINGNVTNAADEEDIASDENHLLKLKDRNSLDGMGYVILRKNKSFQKQVKHPNTIYEVRYDFDLGDAEITMRENCVLKFEGGSLGSGTVVGNNTTLLGVYKINNVEFLGSFRCKELHSSNFNYSDDNALFRNISVLCKSNQTTSVYFEDREYSVRINEHGGCVFDIPSYTSVYLSGTISLQPNGFAHFDVIRINNAKEVNLIGPAKIIGDAVLHEYEYNASGSLVSTYEWGHNIKVTGSRNVLIEDITSIDAIGDSLGIDSSDFGKVCSNISVKSCTFESSRRQGISIEGVDGVEIYGCHIKDIGKGGGGVTSPGAGIDLEPWRSKEENGETHNEYCRNVIIDGCIISNCYGGDISSATYIDNIVIRNSSLSVINSFHKNDAGAIEYYNCIIGAVQITSGKVNFTASKIGKITYFKGVTSRVSNCVIDYSYCSKSLMNYEYLSVINLGDKTSGAVFNIQISNCSINTGPYGLTETHSTTISPDSTTIISNCYIKSEGDAVTGTFDMINNSIECGIFSVKSALGRMYNVIGNTILVSETCEDTARSAIMLRKVLQEFDGCLVNFSYNKVFNIKRDNYANIIYPYEDKKLEFNNYTIKWVDNSILNAFSVQYESDSWDLIHQIEVCGFNKVYGSFPQKNKYRKIGKTDPSPGPFDKGTSFYNYEQKKLKIWDGSMWLDPEGNPSESYSSGLFSERPSGVKIGYGYYCTDKQTTEGASNGIMIYYKGNGTWVDALGRVVK